MVLPVVTLALGDPNPVAQPGGAFIIGSSLIGSGVIGASQFQAVDRSALMRRFELTRGRSHPQDPTPPGAANITVDNRGGLLKRADFRPGLPAEIGIGGACAFTGRIYSAKFRRNALSGDSIVQLVCADDMRKAGETTKPGVLGAGAGDSPGGRIGRALDELTPPPDAGRRDLDPGAGSLQATDLSIPMATVMRQAVDADHGFLFVDRRGVWRFIDRTNHWNPAAFADPLLQVGVPGFEVAGFDTDWSARRTINDAQVTPDGLAEQRTTDPDSITENGRRSYKRTMQLQTTSQAAALTGALVDRYKDPNIDSDQIRIHGSRGNWPGTIGALDLGQVLQVVEAGQPTRNVILQGLRHTWEPLTGLVTLLDVYEISAQLSSAFIIGTSLIGTGTIGAN